MRVILHKTAAFVPYCQRQSPESLGNDYIVYGTMRVISAVSGLLVHMQKALNVIAASHVGDLQSGSKK